MIKINFKYFFAIICFAVSLPVFSQDFSVLRSNNLSGEIKETSGLLLINGKLFTHNDSGNLPYLYEIDTLTGEINRRIFIQNAHNTDWEDIAQDSNFVYIGDIGNNLGDRTDLCIYRISKNQLLQNDTVIVTDTITYSYSDQNDFSPQDQNTAFDAEALIAFGDSLYVFSKNWSENNTKYYAIPKNAKNYRANPSCVFLTQGMITGADILAGQNKIALVGYNSVLLGFVYILSGFNDSSFFSGIQSFYNISDSIGINQIEGIAFTGDNKLYVSAEEFDYTYNGNNYTVSPKLLQIKISEYNGINKLKLHQCIKIYPNPASEYINVDAGMEKSNIQIFDLYGHVVLQQNINKRITKINITFLSKGVYMLKVNSVNKMFVKM